MEIIIDTNFLITSVKKKIQLFEEIRFLYPINEIIIPKQIIAELELLKDKKELNLEEREAAKISLELVKRQVITRLDLGTKNADAGIVRYCKKNIPVIATLDRNLKEKIKRINKEVQFLTIKEKKRIVLQ